MAKASFSELIGGFAKIRGAAGSAAQSQKALMNFFATVSGKPRSASVLTSPPSVKASSVKTPQLATSRTKSKKRSAKILDGGGRGGSLLRNDRRSSQTLGGGGAR